VSGDRDVCRPHRVDGLGARKRRAASSAPRAPHDACRRGANPLSDWSRRLRIGSIPRSRPMRALERATLMDSAANMPMDMRLPDGIAAAACLGIVSFD
jgi:hypothetical protein